MFFTREDILKIQAELTRLGVKDSEFRDAHTPLDNNDTLVLSQGGRNVKIRIQDFLEQLHLLSSDDFINVTTKFDAHHLSLQEAIQVLPSKVRKIGLTITFQNIEGNWEIWQFTSNNIHQFNESSAWENCKVSVDSIAIPDEEDLTMITQGTRLVTKFKDKAYDPASFSGMGRVYLRKNVTKVQDPNTRETKTVNLLTLKMLGKENTIYVILYDYNLNGQTINVPENCILKFEGGSLSNGTIVGNITNIIANHQVFSNISIEGDWSVPKIKSSWFGNARALNKIQNVFKLSNDSINNDIIIEEGDYLVSIEVGNTSAIEVKSNTNIILLGNIILKDNNLRQYKIISIEGKENVHITGSGTINGNNEGHSDTGGEWGMGIYIAGSNNVEIKGINITSCWGDGIYVSDLSDSVFITSTDISSCRRQGISVTSCKTVVISDNKIHDIEGTNPEAAIDVEPNDGDICDNVFIKNNVIYNCTGITSYNAYENATINNLTIDNNIIYDTKRRGINIRNVKNTIISNNKVNTSSRCLSLQSDNVKVLNNYLICTMVDDNDCCILGLGSDNSIIESNTIIANDCAAVKIYGNNTIYSNNNITSKYFISVDSAVIDNQVFKNNVINCTVFNVKTRNSNYDGNTVNCDTFSFHYIGNSFVNNSITFTEPLYVSQKALFKNNSIKSNTSAIIHITSNSIFSLNYFENIILMVDVENVIINNNNFTINHLNKSIFINKSSVCVISNTFDVVNADNEQNIIELSSNELDDIYIALNNSNSSKNYIIKSNNSESKVYGIYNKAPGDRTSQNNFMSGLILSTLTKPFGTSEERPAKEFIAYSTRPSYFDTTLNKPIWWTGSKWVDSTGADI